MLRKPAMLSTLALLMAASVCRADLLPGGICGDGTMADFISLGDSGCVTPQSIAKWSNISFSGTLNGQAIDPAVVAISFREYDLSPWKYLSFEASIYNPPPSLDFEVDFAYTIQRFSTYRLSTVASGITTYGGDVLGTFAYRISQDVCQNGTYTPNCTGDESLNNPGNVWFEIDDGVSVASVRSHATWKSSTNNFLLRFNGAALFDNRIVPEPGTAGLVTTGLGFGCFVLAIRKNRGRQP